MAFSHRTVLLEETVRLLRPGAGRVIVDGTLGGGGHAEALLAAGASVIGIDRDPAARAAASKRLESFGARFTAVDGSFGNVATVVGGPVDGLLLDLGVSSHQLDTAERGFSFQNDGPLDMRMADHGETVAELIERLDEKELADVIYLLGEERFSRQIAASFKRALPKTTAEAAKLVELAVPRKAWPDRIHVATKTFQALRMEVNDELGQLRSALAALPSLLRPGGVAAVISFHSLEDREVKVTFRKLCGEDPDYQPPRGLPVIGDLRKSDFLPLSRKAITASDAELSANPRSRSAKLRAIEKKS